MIEFFDTNRTSHFPPLYDDLLGRSQANICFHFAGEDLPDITKSRDAGIDNKEFSSLQFPVFKPQVAIFQLRSSHKWHEGFHVI